MLFRSGQDGNRQSLEEREPRTNIQIADRTSQPLQSQGGNPIPPPVDLLAQFQLTPPPVTSTGQDRANQWRIGTRVSDQSRHSQGQDQVSGACGTDWLSAARRAIAEARWQILPYKGKKVSVATSEQIHAKATRIVESLLDAGPFCPVPMRDEIGQVINEVTEIDAELLDRATAIDEDLRRMALSDTGSGQGSPPTSGGRPASRSVAPTAVSFSEKRIRYLLDRLKPESLHDIAPGATVSPDKVRHLHDVEIKVVRDLIKECLDLTTKYSTFDGANPQMVERVAESVEFASE